MKLGSLFDGSGGFPLAGFMCDIEPVWASEVEPYPIAVTKSRFPYMKHLGDISKINGAEIEPVDIITFGSPCQDLSVAGKRAGLKHEGNGDEETTRSGLFMEAVRIIKEMREKTNGKYPRWICWENVPGAFSSNKGEDFKIVLEEIIKIVEPTASMPDVPRFGWAYADSYCGDGWSLAYRVFDAQFWGVPQRRRRIYLVADFGGQSARKVLFEREGLRGDFAQGGTPRQATPTDAKRSAGADDSAGEIPYTLKIRSGCEGGGKGALVQENMSATLACNNDQYLFQPVVSDETVALEGNGQRPSHRGDGYLVTDKSYTLNSTEVHGVAYQEVIGSLYARDAAVGSQYVEQNKLIVEPYEVHNRYIVRRMTPTECARLQGFQDRWGDIDKKTEFSDEEYLFWLDVRNTHAAINGRAVKDYNKKQMLTWYNKLHTDSAEYKMWGNGIALPTALYVMQGIKEVSNESY